MHSQVNCVGKSLSLMAWVWDTCSQPFIQCAKCMVDSTNEQVNRIRRMQPMDMEVAVDEFKLTLHSAGP